VVGSMVGKAKTTMQKYQ